MTSTTDFSTRFWRKFSVLRMLIVVLLSLAEAQAEGITVKSANVDLVDDAYQLSANFDLGFTQTIEDAINRGLTMPFVVEFDISRRRTFLWDETIATETRPRQVSYNALTRQYRLSIGSLYQNFDRLQDVKQVLSSVRLDLADRAALKKGVTYEIAIRMRLDVSRLPKPFQVNALGSKEWNLPSDWYRFDFVP